MKLKLSQTLRHFTKMIKSPITYIQSGQMDEFSLVMLLSNKNKIGWPTCRCISRVCSYILLQLSAHAILQCIAMMSLYNHFLLKTFSHNPVLLKPHPPNFLSSYNPVLIQTCPIKTMSFYNNIFLETCLSTRMSSYSWALSTPLSSYRWELSTSLSFPLVSGPDMSSCLTVLGDTVFSLLVSRQWTVDCRHVLLSPSD